MLESDIERAACNKARLDNWLPVKVGHSGFPDRLFIKNGRYVWIEFKQPGGWVRRLQKVRIFELRAKGAEVHVCEKVSEAMEILKND